MSLLVLPAVFLESTASCGYFVRTFVCTSILDSDATSLNLNTDLVVFALRVERQAIADGQGLRI